MTAIQLSSAKTSLGRLKQDISDIDSSNSGTFLEWCNFANRQIYNYLIGIDNSMFVQPFPYTVTASGAQALPTDLLTFRGTGMGFFRIDANNEATANRLPVTGYGSRQQGFYLEGTNVYFTGFNTTTNFILRYLPKPATFTKETEYFTLDGTETDEPIIEDFYRQALVADLNVLYSQWDEDMGMEGVADFRFTRTISEMGEYISRGPRVRQVPFFNNSY